MTYNQGRKQLTHLSKTGNLFAKPVKFSYSCSFFALVVVAAAEAAATVVVIVVVVAVAVVV